MPPRYTPPSTRNIRRIDSPRSHGYQVHVERNGKVYTKHFSDSQYPSPAKARKAAMEYRDRLLAELPPSQPQQGFRLRAQSNTGEVGISLTYQRRRNGEKKPYVTVSASPEPGKMLGRKFMVERYGYEGAIREAKAWRDTVLAERRRKLERQREKDQRRLPGEQSTADSTRQPATDSGVQPVAELNESPAEAQMTAPVDPPVDAPQPETTPPAPRRRGRPKKQPETSAESPVQQPAISAEPGAQQPARRRGRPRKQVDASPEVVPPADTPPRRRGRPRKVAEPPAESIATVEAPPKRRGRPRKAVEAPVAVIAAVEAPPKRGRGRPRKEAATRVSEETARAVVAEAPPKRRGRPPKQPTVAPLAAPAADSPAPRRRGRPPKQPVEMRPVPDSPEGATETAPPKRGRGRPRKNANAQ